MTQTLEQIVEKAIKDWTYLRTFPGTPEAEQTSAQAIATAVRKAGYIAIEPCKRCGNSRFMSLRSACGCKEENGL